MFKSFRAKIYGVVSISEGDQNRIDTTVTFTKYKIRLTEEQVNRLYFDPLLVQVVADKMEYEFDKRRNRNDEKMFSIILKQRLNQLDTGLYHLDISLWNKIKANIIHHRYWIDREKEWFFKTLVAATIGFIFSLTGLYLGYRQGYQNGIKEHQKQNQDTLLKLSAKNNPHLPYYLDTFYVGVDTIYNKK